MDAYIFQAALYCATCAGDIKLHLIMEGKAPADPHDESSYDSDDYPKGPYSNGGGEADSPQHCDTCGKFLENPLTSDGIDYVRAAVQEARRSLHVRHSVALDEWAPFYGLDG